jgi:hypothetical protein
MDAILMLLFGSVFVMTSALSYLEIRRIRKRLDAK